MNWAGRFAGYGASGFRRDLVSGLIVGIIAIPLGMAFAIAAGVKPEYGIYTTILAGFLISLFGGSRFQIGGPTGAFVPILFTIVMQYGYEKLLIAGMLAGILLVLMGLFRLGALITYIPRPVTIGFTAGIAVIIFSGQMANFLGLRDIRKHQDFLPNMKEIGMHLSTINVYSIITAGVCLAAILVTPKFFPRLPGSLVGLLVSTCISVWLFDGKVDTIGSTFGAISSTLPAFHVPDVTLDTVKQLIPPAFVIAMLGGIESLLSAVVADGMSGTRHNSNRELIGQGIANMITPLFGGIPATGAIARTAANIKTGAASPFSGMIHSLVVLLVLLSLAPLASSIPLAAMAPILMMVAWNMSERKEFVHLLLTKTADSVVLLLTFLLTVLTDLTTAVESGLVLAVILFVKSMSGVLKVKEGNDCPQLAVYTVEGALFFGAAAKFQQSIMQMFHHRPKILLLKLSKVPFMDTTGEWNLSALVKEAIKHGGTVIVSGLKAQPKKVMHNTGLEEIIGSERVFEHTGDAMNYALTQLDHGKCLGCKHFAFRECTALSKSGQPVQLYPKYTSGHTGN